MESTFTAKLLAKSRITVPEASRDLIRLKQGDIVEVTIKKRIPEPVNVGDVIGKPDKQN